MDNTIRLSTHRLIQMLGETRNDKTIKDVVMNNDKKLKWKTKASMFETKESASAKNTKLT